jgi:hypothetical protein
MKSEPRDPDSAEGRSDMPFSSHSTVVGSSATGHDCRRPLARAFFSRRVGANRVLESRQKSYFLFVGWKKISW